MATERSESAPLRMIFERRKRSCGECRRRKQKCDQRQPCRNCLRRIPQPECRYQTTPRRARITSEEGDERGKQDLHDKARDSYDFSDATLSPDPTELLNFDDLFRMPCSSGIRYSYDGHTSPYSDWTVPKEDVPLAPTEASEGPTHRCVLSFWPERYNSPSHSMFAETCRRNIATTAKRNAMLGARFAAIKHLHTLLKCQETAVSDEAIIVAVKLAFNDLCFGQPSELLLHIDGAREMVRARGGLTALSSTPHLAKMVLVADLVTAIVLETRPCFPYNELGAYTDYLRDSSAPSQSHHHQPHLHSSRSLPTMPSAGSGSGSKQTAPLTMNPTTSALLKDTVFLIDTVLALPPDPSPWELQKVRSMSSWVDGRLSSATTTLPPFDATSTNNSNTQYHLHQAIRMSSLFYCRAIHARRPLSEVVTEQDIAELVRAVSEIPLEIWEVVDNQGELNKATGKDCVMADRGGGGGGGGERGEEKINFSMMEGLISLLAVVLPSAAVERKKNMMGGGIGEKEDEGSVSSQDGHTARTMVLAASVELALRDWGAVVRVLGRMARLQGWLASGVKGQI